MLSGVNVALGVTGSIAAVKTVELAHELRRQGASVRAVVTESARGIIHPWSLEFATDHDPITEITGRVEHIELCGTDGWADVFLIAPATANTLGKIAAAIDDTPVTTCATTALGAGLPIVVAPAMHEPMYDHPGVLDSIARLEEWGVTFVDPRIEEEKAKIAEPDRIVLETARAVEPTPLADHHIVVTGGGTAEAIDPVRILTNRASGKTGRAVARGCYARGADVTLIHRGEDVDYAQVRRVESAADMIAAVEDQLAQDGDALISTAAISDYTVESADSKLESGRDLSLDLEPTPKLIDEVRAAYPDLPIVGFKVESTESDETLLEEARRIRDRVGLAFVVANNASVMGADDTRVLLVTEDDHREFVGTKTELGFVVADELATRL